MKITTAQRACLQAIMETQNPWNEAGSRQRAGRSQSLAALHSRGLVIRPSLTSAIITQAGITALESQ